MKKFASAAVGVALCTIAWSSQAQETKFGDKGTLVVHAATGSPMLTATPSDGGEVGLSYGATPTLGFQTQKFTTPETCNGNNCREYTASVTALYLNPRLHYFVIDNLSIGGEVLLGTWWGSIESRDRDPRTDATTTNKRDLESMPTSIGIMPMVGYNIRLGNRFSIWPQGGIGFRHTGFTDENDLNNPNDDVDTSFNWWYFNADVPFMLHIAEHFSLGAGPGLTATLSHNRTDTFGGTDRSTSGFTNTAFRWFNAHLTGYF